MSMFSKTQNSSWRLYFSFSHATILVSRACTLLVVFGGGNSMLTLCHTGVLSLIPRVRNSSRRKYVFSFLPYDIQMLSPFMETFISIPIFSGITFKSKSLIRFLSQGSWLKSEDNHHREHLFCHCCYIKSKMINLFLFFVS